MVYVGRMGAEKRLKDIKAMLETLPGARLCLVGGGPQTDELKEHFAGTNTVFTGQLSGDELSAAFASADAFMMPSDSETLGFVVLESMASGVPVIGCKAGGIPDLIRDQDTGFLVEAGDTDGYVACAKKLMDPTFRKEMGVRARTEAEKWGWEAATSVLRNVQYEKALINFHSRAFGGFGKPKTAGMFKLLRARIARLLGKLRVPGFRRNAEIPDPI
jgi:sulfoquinovosyltransferase